MAFGKFHGLKAVLESNQQCSQRGMSPGEQGGQGPPSTRMWQEQDKKLPQEHCYEVSTETFMKIKCLFKQRRKALFL